MREKYESLSLVVLRDLAKARGLKNISSMKKSDLVNRMLEEDARKQKETESMQMQEERGERVKAKDGTERSKDHAQPKEYSRKRTEYVPRERGTDADRQTKEKAEEPVETQENQTASAAADDTMMSLDSGITANGILEVMPDGYGFIRCENYLPGEHDVYVSPSQIRKFNLKTGDIVCGNTRIKTQQEKFSALLYVTTINGYHPSVAQKRKSFEDLTPIFPNERIRLERPGCSVAMRIVDLVSPIGKGQRGMIVSQPKAGKQHF